ncbi:hypothetical protein BKA57DRAFT_465612 [Linnemannia elongata]|nr:hypothetical protein BKA57DRAFT_465612 [Linnemannia elongata]
MSPLPNPCVNKESIIFAIYASFCFVFLFCFHSLFALLFFFLFSFFFFRFVSLTFLFALLRSFSLLFSLSSLSQSSILITHSLSFLHFPSLIPSHQLRINTHTDRHVVRVCRVLVQLCLQQTRNFAPTRPAPAAPPLQPHQTHPPCSPTN